MESPEKGNIAHATAKLRGLLALGSVGQLLVRMVGRMERAACVWSPLPAQGQGEGEGLFKATGLHGLDPTLVLSPLCKGRGEKGVCCASFQLQTAHKEDEPAVFLHAKKTHPSLRLVEPCARRSEPLYCGKRLGENEDAARKCSARRAAFR